MDTDFPTIQGFRLIDDEAANAVVIHQEIPCMNPSELVIHESYLRLLITALQESAKRRKVK